MAASPPATPGPARPRLAWLDRAGFLIGSALIGPYALWVSVVEREMFSRVPLVLVITLFLLALQFYFVGARDWLLRRKPRRVRLTFALLALAFGLMPRRLVDVRLALPVRGHVSRPGEATPRGTGPMDGIHFEKSLDHLEEARRYAGSRRIPS